MHRCDEGLAEEQLRKLPMLLATAILGRIERQPPSTSAGFATWNGGWLGRLSKNLRAGAGALSAMGKAPAGRALSLARAPLWAGLSLAGKRAAVCTTHRFGWHSQTPA